MAFLIAALGFFSGSVLYSLFLPRIFKGIDIRESAPDHNPGASNAFKFGGTALGIASLICDLAKAWLPVRLGILLVGTSNPVFSLILCAPVLGHAFSPFVGFRGGKAIAASFGALLAILPESTAVVHLAFWYILFSTLLLIRPHAVRTIMAFGLTALYTATQPLWWVAVGTACIFAVTTCRHLPSVRCEPFSLHLLGLKVFPRESSGKVVPGN